MISVGDMMFGTMILSIVIIGFLAHCIRIHRQSKLDAKVRNKEWEDVDNTVFAEMISEGEVSSYTYNSYYVTLKQQQIIVSTSRERKAVTCVRMCTNTVGDRYDRVVRGEVDGGILYDLLMEKLNKQEQEVFNGLKKRFGKTDSELSNTIYPIAPPPPRIVRWP